MIELGVLTVVGKSIDKAVLFLPPMDKMMTWRLIVGLSALAFWIAVVVAISPYGFAKAQDVKVIQLDLKEERILERHRDFCLSPQGSEQANYYLSVRNMIIREYNDIAKEPFDSRLLPACDLLRPSTPR